MPSVNWVPPSEPADPVPRLLDWETKARAAGWVPLADVLDAVWDIDAIQRWASRSGVPLGSFIGHQQIRDYLADRFTTAPEGADERNGHG